MVSMDVVGAESRKRHRTSLISRDYNEISRRVTEKNVPKLKLSLNNAARHFDEYEQSHYDYLDAIRSHPDFDTSLIKKQETSYSQWLQSHTTAMKTGHDWLAEQGLDVSVVVGQDTSASTDSGSVPPSESTLTKEVAARLSLPTQRIPKFSGKDIRAYTPFKKLFDVVIGTAISDPQEKLVRLASYLEGDALRAIYSCLLKGGEAGYDAAVDTLQRRYGDIHAISATIVRDLGEGKSAHKPAELRQLSDDVIAAEQLLKSTGVYTRIDNPDFIRNVLSRCRPYVAGKWRKQALAAYEETPPRILNWSDLSVFLARQARDACNSLYGDDMYRSHVPSKAAFARSSAISHLQTDKSNDCCGHCSQGGHTIERCTKFKQLTPQERYASVFAKRLCFRCLSEGHRARECPSTAVCGQDGCNRRHHTLLHSDSPVGRSSVNHHFDVSETNCALGVDDSAVCLPLTKVRVNGSHVAVALLDPGSSCTLISRSLAQRLKLTGDKVEFTLQTVNGKKTLDSSTVAYQVSSMDGSYVHDVDHSLVVSDIPASAPSNSPQLHEYGYLADLKFADIKPGTRADLIIGQDHSEMMIPLQVRSGEQGVNLPYAIRTRLGWVLNGKFGSVRASPGQAFGICSHITIDEATEIKSKVDNLWSIEHEGETNDSWSVEDRNVYDMWERCSFLQDGRYVVPIPWRDGRPNLPNNRFLALKRLESTLRKLDRTGMRARYDAGIQKYLDDGHAEMVPPESLARNDGEVWYLPHHGVYQEVKDKLRIVHDCSALYQQVSLNNSCFRGPVLVNDLRSVLLRFRQHAHAWTADVTAMYLQVVIPEEDRDCLRFLWQRDGEIVELRMTRHLFGGVWCSSSSAYALLRTLRDFQADAMVRDVVSRSMYVDDLLRSFPFDEAMCDVIIRVCSVLLKGGFPLSKHMVNVPAVLESIPEEERAKEAQVITDSLRCKALGIRWDVVLDTFQYVKIVVACLVVCKRFILSNVASLFDPLGLLAPVLILGRQIFQRCVRLGLEWDEPVPPELRELWSRWSESLARLESLSFPRCIVPPGYECAKAELHHFCDGSLSAYGVCSYLRLQVGDAVFVSLVCARARLVPLNVLTVPRVELCGAKMATDAEEVLRRDLDLDLRTSTYWCDSQVVLAYINSEAGRFKPFVSNRVSSIRSRSDPSQWRYVPTDLNAADVVTKGCLPEDVPASWFHGPEFLSLPRHRWSEFVPDLVIPDVSGDDGEVRRSAAVHAVASSPVTPPSVHPLDKLLAYYSDYSRLLRAVSWLRRVVRRGPSGPLSATELSRSETVLLRHVQGTHYVNELSALRSGVPISKRSDISDLDPVLHDGLLVVGGRISRSSKSFRECHPVILPGKSRLARLILSREHGRAHLGVEWTLCRVRSRFWVTGARNILRGIRSLCGICQRLYGRPRFQKMSDLPPDRVTAKSLAFEDVGLDLFGPFYVSQGRSRVKRWGCLFTCMAIRAVHVEILASMDTDSFINAFRRFSARRGTPRMVRSDQGTNFVGALSEFRREFQNVDKARVVAAAGILGVEWIFNPPHSSHMGGTWERMIRTLRKVLLAIMPSGSVADEVLHTVFVEAENLVNSRPLTRVSSDCADGAALTPNHLLIMSGNVPALWGKYGVGEIARRKWKLVQHLLAEFWSRWSREYVPSLQHRQKWREVARDYAVGDVVIVLEDQLKSLSGKWPLALVTEVVPSADGKVRHMKLRFNGSEVMRPITKVVPLELD